MLQWIRTGITLDLLRRSRIPAALGGVLGRLVHPTDRVMAPFGLAEHPLRTDPVRGPGTGTSRSSPRWGRAEL